MLAGGQGGLKRLLLVRDERFCLDEVFYLSVFDEAAGIMGFIRILIPFGYVGL